MDSGVAGDFVGVVAVDIVRARGGVSVELGLFVLVPEESFFSSGDNVEEDGVRRREATLTL